MTDLGSIVWGAIVGELESLEHRGQYIGNGHHLAQRLAELVKKRLAEENCIVVKTNHHSKEAMVIK